MQGDEIQMGLKRVVMKLHLILHRCLGVMAWTAVQGSSSVVALADPVALPVSNPPAGSSGILAIGEHQINGSRQKAAADELKLFQGVGVVRSEALLGFRAKGCCKMLRANGSPLVCHR